MDVEMRVVAIPKRVAFMSLEELQVRNEELEKENAAQASALRSVRERVEVLQTMCLGPPGLVSFLEATAVELNEALTKAGRPL